MRVRNVAFVVSRAAPVRWRAVASILFASILGAAAFGSAPASAQSLEEIRDQLRRSIGRGPFADLVIGFTLINTTPEVSTGTFTIESGGAGDADLQTFKIPLQKYVPVEGAPGALFLEASFGYLAATEDLQFVLDPGPPPIASAVDTRWTAYSALVGAGWKLPIGSGFSLRPSASLAYSRIESKARYDGLGDLLIAPIADGILYNWDADAVTAAGSLALFYDRDLTEVFAVDFETRYTLAHVDVFRATDRVQEGSTTRDFLNTGLGLSGPLGVSLFDAPLSWRVFGNHVWFLDLDRSTLGFDQYIELGGRVDMSLESFGLPLSNTHLSASLVRGGDIRGYSIGLGAAF